MPSINVKEILNVSKTALVQHGSDDWVAAHVAEALPAQRMAHPLQPAGQPEPCPASY